MDDIHYGSLTGIAIAMALAAAVPAFFPRLLIPGVVMEIVLGAIIGPQGLHVLVGGPIADLLYTLGLAMLFLIAGYEVNPVVLRGRPIDEALLGWSMSAALAFGAATLLVFTGAAHNAFLTALAMSTTTLGALMPILRDSNLLWPPYGPFVLSAGAVGEVAPIVALSLVLAGHGSGLQAAILIVFGVAAAALVYVLTKKKSALFSDVVKRSLSSSGQFPVRLGVCVLIVLVAISSQLNIDLVLGAFVAGMLLRSAIPTEQHEHVAVRLDGLGFAFLVPMFFIISGSRLDVAALFSSWQALAMVPLYALVMLVVRGFPAIVMYHRDLELRQRLGLALHSGTQLSLVVAITAIATHRGLIPGVQAAAMVGGGIVTLVLYPALARIVLSKPQTPKEATA